MGPNALEETTQQVLHIIMRNFVLNFYLIIIYSVILISIFQRYSTLQTPTDVYYNEMLIRSILFYLFSVLCVGPGAQAEPWHKCFSATGNPQDCLRSFLNALTNE